MIKFIDVSELRSEGETLTFGRNKGIDFLS